ncbi:hypothetical protein RUND412_004847 [Rhizina undulata]
MRLLPSTISLARFPLFPAARCIARQRPGVSSSRCFFQTLASVKPADTTSASATTSSHHPHANTPPPSPLSPVQRVPTIPRKSLTVPNPATNTVTTQTATRLSPYVFNPGYSLFAKRPPRPFPPPFNSPPASSFSDPLSTHNLSRAPAYYPKSEGAAFLRGVTNGDDAIIYSPTHLAVADGVGAWNTKSAGHAPLWSRLMLHFWSCEVENGVWGLKNPEGPDPVACLQEAYHSTIHATSTACSTVWQGTTTACVAVIKDRQLLVANVGDSKCFVIRPKAKGFVLETEDQWHWFDCPRQLGTNSPDTPQRNAVVSKIDIEDGDVIVLATDGLPDNLWEHEILTSCLESLEASKDRLGGQNRMLYLADRLVQSAKAIAMDPFAESPYMQRGIEEGLGVEGGKWDDISVVAAQLKFRE